MSLSTLLYALSQVDATIATVVAALFVVFTQRMRQRRGLTTRRLMEASLSAILLWVLSVRYGITAIALLVDSSALLGPGVPRWAAGTFSAVALVLAFVGWVTHRGSVAMRISGAVILAAASVVEAVLGVFVFDLPALAQLDNDIAIAVSAAALVLAAFHWSHRSATPNPLGGDSRPLDY